MIITVPYFPGFYHSWLSDAIDHEFESFVEYEADYKQSDIPAELRLSESEISDIAFDCMDYSAAYLNTAHKFLAGIQEVASDVLGFDVPMEWESMTSPREYNFKTNQLFATISADTVQKLFDVSLADEHDTLRKLIAERFTSRSGFFSHYPNDIETWLKKPLAEWDHNELQTLLMAAMESQGYDDSNLDLHYATTDCDGLYHEFEAGMNFTKFDAKMAETKDMFA